MSAFGPSHGPRPQTSSASLRGLHMPCDQNTPSTMSDRAQESTPSPQRRGRSAASREDDLGLDPLVAKGGTAHTAEQPASHLR
jgi:hypothetical protein